MAFPNWLFVKRASSRAAIKKGQKLLKKVFLQTSHHKSQNTQTQKRRRGRRSLNVSNFWEFWNCICLFYFRIIIHRMSMVAYFLYNNWNICVIWHNCFHSGLAHLLIVKFAFPNCSTIFRLLVMVILKVVRILKEMFARFGLDKSTLLLTYPFIWNWGTFLNSLAEFENYSKSPTLSEIK